MIKKLSLVLMLLIGSLLAQAPQRNTVDSKSTAFMPYQQPPAPALAGLWVNVNTGSFWVSGNPVTLATVRLSVAPNTTNYIYVDLTNNSISRNTTGFGGSVYPVAIAVTNGFEVTGLSDVRPDVFGAGASGGGVGIFTVATLPSGFPKGTLASVTDGSSTTDCTVGGGTTNVLCVYSGTTWGVFLSSGSVNSVNGTANQITISGPASNPVVGITTNPTLPGNVTIGANFTLFGQLYTADSGNSGIVQQTGTVNAGTASSCFDVNGNITNVGCSPTAGSIVAAPGGGQSVIQPVTTAFCANNDAGVRYVSCGYNWTQSPAGTISPGSNTITLPAAILGIDVTNSTIHPYRIHIGATGTPESVVITSGTYTAAAGGTITFTAANSHSAGFTLGSDTAGYQEAINDAGSPNAVVHGQICTGSSPCSTIFSTIFAWPNKMTLDLQGAHLSCQTRDRCVYLGDLNGNAYAVKLRGGRFAAGINVDGIQNTNASCAAGTCVITTNGNHPFVQGDSVYTEWYTTNGYQRQMVTITAVSPTTYSYTLGSLTSASAAAFGWTALEAAAVEDNADHSRIDNAQLTSVGNPNRFDFGIVIAQDQAADVQHVNNEGSSNVIRCTSNYCGAFIMTRGDNGNAGILFLSNSELSMQCGGNGVLGLSGNGLHVGPNVIIQGYNQYGVTYESNLQAAEMSFQYEEVGACANPQYTGIEPSAANGGVNAVGVIQHGKTLSIDAPTPLVGQIPKFANTGANQRNYFIVGKSSINNASNAFLAGFALTNGAGNVVVAWPQFPAPGSGTVTYDVLLTTGTTNPAPYVGNATSLTTASTGVTCANGVCQFTDTHAAGSAYTMPAVAWTPYLYFWPGTVHLGVQAEQTANYATLITNTTGTTLLSGITSVNPNVPTVFLQQCGNLNNATWSPVMVTCMGGDLFLAATQATMMPSTGAGGLVPTTNSKGRLNFGKLTGSPPYHLVTWNDSAITKTTATVGHRPLNDSTDCWTGVDQVDGLAFGCNTSISEYIANNGSGTALTRLTSTLFNLTVPLTSSGVGTFGGVGTNSGTTSFGCNATEATALSSHVGIGVLNGSCTPWNLLLPLAPVGDTTNSYPLFFKKDGSGNEVGSFGGSLIIDATLPQFTTGAADPCVAISNALTAFSTYGTVVDARGFGNPFNTLTSGWPQFKCSVNPIPVGTQSLLLLPAGIFKLQASWQIPNRFTVIGQGWDANPPTGVGATTLQACTAAEGAICAATTFPAAPGGPLLCWQDRLGGCGNGSSSPDFDAEVFHITIDGKGVLGAICVQAMNPEENAGLRNFKLMNCGNKGRFLQIAGSSYPQTGAGAQVTCTAGSAICSDSGGTAFTADMVNNQVKFSGATPDASCASAPCNYIITAVNAAQTQITVGLAQGQIGTAGAVYQGPNTATAQVLQNNAATQNSDFFNGYFVNSASATTTTDGIEILMVTGSASNEGPKLVNVMTLVNSSATQFDYAIRASGYVTHFDHIHCESPTIACFVLGLDNNSQSIVYSNSQVGGITAGASDLARVSSAFTTIQYAFENLTSVSPLQPTNTMNDQQCSRTLTTATARSLMKYAVGATCDNVVTTAPSIGPSAHPLLAPLRCADTSASATTYTCTTVPSFTPAAGDIIEFTTINQVNSGSSTLNVNGAGAKTIKKTQGQANLAANDLRASGIVLLSYDGTNWKMLTQLGN